MNKPKITILGSGGAFDTKEGNSSFLIELGRKNFLLDCGSTIFSRLMSRNLVEKIDAVCVTHMHDDHIGSLSALIHYRYFKLGKKTEVITTPQVAVLLIEYLKGQGHNIRESFDIGFKVLVPDQSGNYNCSVKPFPTTGFHMMNMSSCGFVFKNEDFNVIVSGDIGCPITELPRADFFVWDYNPKNTFIFHDATTKNYQTHAHYLSLESLAKDFAVYAYHHSSEEEDEMIDKADWINTVYLY